MSFYYIFLRGKIVLLENGTVPQQDEAACLEKSLVNSGLVDRHGESDDRWGELDGNVSLPAGFAAFERRGCWTAVGEEQFFRICKAFHIMDWQRLHKYCGRCGAENEYDEAEGAMRCKSCGELFYPVISPAVIVCVEKEGKILLGHGVNFPAGRYSVLAGFVEPGENLEECVRREVWEEAHIKLKNIRYFASQPWPFPRSLMLGFTAEWESGEICPDTSEVTDVQWFAPDEIPEYYRGVSISAKLIEDFTARHKKS